MNAKFDNGENSRLLKISPGHDDKPDHNLGSIRNCTPGEDLEFRDPAAENNLNNFKDSNVAHSESSPYVDKIDHPNVRLFSVATAEVESAGYPF